MNGRRAVVFALAAALGIGASQMAAQADLESLRGMTPIENPSPVTESGARKTDRTAVARNYAQQPPLIPHPTFAYRINREQNKCLSCHGVDKAEESGAPAPSKTHYLDREGNTLADVSSSRYFCNQCHVEQFTVEPLVENVFRPAKAPQ